MTAMVRVEKINVSTVKGGQLYVRHLAPGNAHASVLMLHGLGSSGEVFVHEQRGLANYLSELGFECFVPDLVGHGQSWPHLSKHLDHTVNDIVAEDMPRLLAEIHKTLNGKPLFLIGQGFGSVLMMSTVARYPEVLQLIDGFVHFNARRSARLSGAAYSGICRSFWRHLLPMTSVFKGSVPMQWLPDCSEPEIPDNYQTWLKWSEGDWIDSVDDFDYQAAFEEIDLPPSLYLTARSKAYRSNTADVREFMRELGTHNARMLVLAKGDGNLRNYNSLTMLQHDDAWVDHFPRVLDWLNERIKAS